MPLGDSITYGLSADNDPTVPYWGGYRYHLWNQFQTNNLQIDFVGSQSHGAVELGDKDHEGHSGKTISWINDRVSTFFNPAQPDIVLLMIGSNDTGTSDSPATIAARLGTLIDNILRTSPDVTVLVSSIPPARPEARGGEARIQKINDYNNLIPSIVNARANPRVKFVDMRGKLDINDITAPPADDALHPNFEGYRKISSEWYTALSRNFATSQGTFSVDQDTLVSVENVIGSRFDDMLIADASNNRLTGGDGRDHLTGGAGNDTFVYFKPSEGGDTITDFSFGDSFEISAAGFGNGLVSGVSLLSTPSSSGVFVNGSLPISAHVTFLYENGVLRFDPDGIGSQAAVVIASLNNSPLTLSSQQIRIV
ncbi:GDSL-type esterase/lipase family protein [Leptolyngbya boryana IU 594]|nr:GDSL-type esterase/lipase family protein [Leptolyngbya boryana IU 594]